MPKPNGQLRRSGGHGSARRLAGVTAIIALVVGACGSEDDNDAGSASTPIDTTGPPTTAAPVTTQAEPTTTMTATTVPTSTTVPPTATAPTTTSARTTTSAPTTSIADGALTADDFVGIWASDGSIYLVQYNADGTYAVAVSEDQFATAPVESGEWELDGTAFTFNTSFSGCPGILDRPGRYEVERLDDTTGAVLWTVVDDPCQGRSSGFELPWSPK